MDVVTPRADRVRKSPPVRRVPPQPLSLDLRGLVREVLASTGWYDPGRVSDETIRRIPDGQLRAALAQTMRAYVRETMRSGMPDAAPQPGVNGKASQNGAARTEGRNGKARMGDAYRRLMAGAVHYAPDLDAYKPYGQCDFGEVLFVAAQNARLARENAARAAQHEAVAAAMREHGAARVADLPRDVFLAAWNTA